ncbi:hypothetical protein F4775DRAFT_575971 [Biscogniauxia sp. FL1348]|nr:hypothetical protein F4775DRAFT_575971 [Biscogniauxia sp. FL1348]
MFWFIRKLSSLSGVWARHLVDIVDGDVIGRHKPQVQEKEKYVPESLRYSHPLMVIDQPAKLEYARRMLIFDFRDTSEGSVERAVAYIRQGLEVAFEHYPFLAGRLGPSAHDTKGNRVQLRYGDSGASRAITPAIFTWKLHAENEYGRNYAFLCARGMPVSHWKPKDYCAAPESFELGEWPQALTMQANFLMEGALVICLAYLQCVADDVSILRFLEIFAAGIRGTSITPQLNLGAGEYKSPSLDKYIESGTTGSYNSFPEWGRLDKPRAERERSVRDIREAFIYTIPAKRIESWKDRVNHYLEHARIILRVSTVELVYAMIWVEITRARHRILWENQPTNTRFSAAIDTRGRLGPSSNRFCFGNMLTRAVAQCSAERMMIPPSHAEEYSECNEAIFAMAALHIQHAIKGIDNTYVRHRMAWVEGPRERRQDCYEADGSKAPQSRMGGDVKFTTLEDFGADIHFGIPGAGTDGDGRPR